MCTCLWAQALQQREELLPYLRQRLAVVAAAHGEVVLDTPGNPISVAMTLDGVEAAAAAAKEAAKAASASAAAASSSSSADADGGGAPPAAAAPLPTGGKGPGSPSQPKAKASASASAPVPPDATFLGSMLWSRCISGTRVVPRGKRQVVAGIEFVGYGSHSSAYSHVYLTAAAAIGTSREEVDEFAQRLGQCLGEFAKKAGSAAAAAAETATAAQQQQPHQQPGCDK